MCNSSHAGTFVDQTGSSTVLITCCFKFRLSQECHTASQVFKKKEETEPPITLKQQMVSPQSTYPRFVHKQMRNRSLDLRKKQLNSARKRAKWTLLYFFKTFFTAVDAFRQTDHVTALAQRCVNRCNARFGPNTASNRELTAWNR